MDYVIAIKNFLNTEGHQNRASGLKVTAILLKGWILPILHWEESAPAACAAGLFLKNIAEYWLSLLVILKCMRLELSENK